MKIKKSQIKLEQSCGACPESYNASVEIDGIEHYLGYLRVRYGHFSVTDNLNEVVYSTSVNGDGLFDSDERDYQLEKAKKHLKKSFNKQNKIKTTEDGEDF